jgi:Family of unknown function (DUF6364)
MNRKLTLSLDERIIQNAKEYAASNNESLSRLVENYFKFIVTKINKKNTPGRNEMEPILNDLSGIISIPDMLDIKEDYRAYKTKKYSK